MKEYGKEQFEDFLVTESVRDQTSPQFTRRAQFKPLSMNDSQRYAMNTILQVNVIINSRKYTTFELPLAHLLWDQFYDIKMPTHVPSSVRGPKNKTSGSTSLQIVRGREDVSSFDDHKMYFLIRTSGNMCRRIFESKMKVALSVVAEKGRWSRLSLSNTVAKSYRSKGGATFPLVQFCRGELSGFTSRNPVRLTLYGVRRGYLRTLGFCQFTVAELSCRDSLSWYGTKLKNIGLINECNMQDSSSSFALTISTSAQVREHEVRVSRGCAEKESKSDTEDMDMKETGESESDISASWASLKGVLRFGKPAHVPAVTDKRIAKYFRTETIRFPKDTGDTSVEGEVNMLTNLTAKNAREIASKAEF